MSVRYVHLMNAPCVTCYFFHIIIIVDFHSSCLLILHLFMAALRSSCWYYIFALWFLSYSSSPFFPRIISAVAEWMSLPYFYTWCGLSANLECRSEMCYTRLAGNTWRKNAAKNRHLGTIAQLCRAVSSQLRHLSTMGKNYLLSSNTSSTCPRNIVNLGLLTIEISLGVWGTPANFSGFRILAA